jgi:hypothetical protein
LIAIVTANPRPTPFDDTIRSICKDGFTKQIPRLAVLIKTFVPADWGDLFVTVSDPTGEMQATISRHVMTEFPRSLCVGSVLLLRRLAVFSPSPKIHYLNIIPKNVVAGA